MSVRDDFFAAMVQVKNGDCSPEFLQVLADRIATDAVVRANSRIADVLNDAVRKLAAAIYWEDLRKLIAAGLGVDEKEAWYVFAPGGSGDVMFAMTFLKAFRERHGGPVVLITPQSFRSLCKLYTGDYDHVFHIKPHWDLLAHQHAIQKGEPIVAGHGTIGRYGDWRTLREIVTLNNLYCLFLGLPFNTAPSPPYMPPGAREAAGAFLEDQGLRPGRTVVLAPFSRSTATPPESWWLELVRILKQRNYDVVTNVAEVLDGPPLKALDGTLPVFCAHEHVTALVEAAGFFIASRSGLSDIVSFSNATMRFVYTSRKRQEAMNNCAIITVNDCQSVTRNRPLDPSRSFELEVDDEGQFDEGILAGF